MNKKFIAEVLKREPRFAAVDHYFFERPVGHIMSGFLCERPPSGAYIWKYAFPLYDRFPFLHLGYGMRLPGTDGFMVVNKGHESALSEEFLRRIKPYQKDVSKLQDLEEFRAYIETAVGLQHPGIRRGYAATQIMLGRGHDAASALSTLLDPQQTGLDHEFTRDVQKLLDDLDAGIPVAQRTLGQWERDAKARLGIE